MEKNLRIRPHCVSQQKMRSFRIGDLFAEERSVGEGRKEAIKIVLLRFCFDLAADASLDIAAARSARFVFFGCALSKRLLSANIIFNLRTLGSSRKWMAILRLRTRDREVRQRHNLHNRPYANRYYDL